LILLSMKFLPSHLMTSLLRHTWTLFLCLSLMSLSAIYGYVYRHILIGWFLLNIALTIFSFGLSRFIALTCSLGSMFLYLLSLIVIPHRVHTASLAILSAFLDTQIKIVEIKTSLVRQRLSRVVPFHLHLSKRCGQ
jgi:hypothetical protein